MNTIECKICQQIFADRKTISNHVRSIHKLTAKNYFDQYLKTIGNSTCRLCGKKTNWIAGLGKYKTHCNRTCAGNDPHMMEQRNKTNLKRYGTENINDTEWKQDKSKQTCLQRYNHECSIHSKQSQEKIEQTWLEKYGTKTPRKDGIISKIINKSIQEKYGVDCAWHIPGVQEKKKQTMLNRYGVEYAMLNKDSHDKNQRNCYRAKLYTLPSKKEIYIRGFEPQFLDYIFKEQLLKENDITFHPTGVKYINLQGKSTYYYPDFFIPKLNLIVEIKSSYTERLDKNIELKKQACIAQGFKYLRVVDNKFDELVAFMNK